MQREIYYMLDTRKLLLASKAEINAILRTKPSMRIRKATDEDMANCTDINTIQSPQFER